MNVETISLNMKQYVTPALRVLELEAEALQTTATSGGLKTDSEHDAQSGMSNLSIHDEVFNDGWDEADED